jgi:predicted ester cyclase
VQDDNIELVNKYFDALNNKNIELCDSIVTTDFKKSSNGKTEDEIGPAVLKKAIKMHSTNNSEYKYNIEDIFASEEMVGVRWRWNSINIKTGEPKPINITAISVFEIKENKISRLWQAFDMGDFNRQLSN